MVSNPYFYSTLSGTPTTQITDSIDFPHTGLVKALSQALRGNYAVKTASDFNITFADGGSFTTIAVTAGKVYRDGKLHTVDALSATNMNTSYNSGTGAVDITPVSSDIYLFLVAIDGGGSNDTMVLRGVNTTINAVPAFVDGDVPIALIKVVGGSADDATSTSTRMVQYFTTSKKENTLSVGYDSSGYTETLSIASNSGDTEITSAVSDKDIIFKGNDGGSGITALTLDMSEAGKATFNDAIAATGANFSGLTASRAVVTDASKNLVSSNITAAEINMLDDIGTDTIATQLATKATKLANTFTSKQTIDYDVDSATASTANVPLHIDYDRVGGVSTGTDTQIGIDLDMNVTGASGGTITTTGIDVDVVGDSGGTSKAVGIDVSVSSADTNYAALFTTGTGTNDTKVGIGTDAPDANLHIKAAANPTIKLQEDGQTGFLKIIGLQDSHVQIFAENQTASEGCILDLDAKSVTGQSQEVRIFRSVNNASDGFFSIKQVGTNNNVFRVYSDKDGTAHKMEMDGKTVIGGTTVDTNAVLTVDGAISIGEISAPTATADRGKLWNQNDNNLYFQDGAGTNTVVLKGGKHSIWIPAEAISPRSNAGCGALATTAAATSGRPDIRALPFDKTADEHGQFTIAMPKMWNEGTITAQFYWTNASVTSGTVHWGLQGVSLSNDNPIDTAFGTAIVTGDTQTGTAKDVHVSAESSAITIAGSPAANDLTCFQVYRDVSADNLNEDALLLGIKIFYTIDAGNDA